MSTSWPFALRLLSVSLCLTPGQPAGAHPHIFVDAGVQILFDDAGQLAAVRVVWAYDAFYSLLILEDRGLDPDADGVLTDAEQASLTGFDMNWDPGFAGDLYALQGGQALALSGPLEPTTALLNGRLVSTHLRALTPRVAVGLEPVILQAYDPTFYTAYRVSTDPQIGGRAGCSAQVFLPDPSAVSPELLAALAELNADQGIDDLDWGEVPPVSAALAEEVRVTCAPLP